MWHERAEDLARRTHELSDFLINVLPANANWLWYMRNLGIVIAVSMVVLLLALSVFGRLEDNFAEEI